MRYFVTYTASRTITLVQLLMQILAHKKGFEYNSPMKLGDLQRKLGYSLEEMIELVEETLHDESYTKEEVAKELGTTVNNLEEVSFTANTKDIEYFKLKQRALHVFKG